MSNPAGLSQTNAAGANNNAGVTHASALSPRAAAILSRTHLLSLTLDLASSSLRSHGTAGGGAGPIPRRDLIRTQTEIDSHLPSSQWYDIPISFHIPIQVSSMKLQHGSNLPVLEVRILHDHTLPRTHHHQHEEEFERLRQLDQTLQWLVESITHGSRYPVLGLDAESDCKLTSDGEIRLIQLSTGTRCVLLRVPDQKTIGQYLMTCEVERKSPSLFSPFFHQLMKNRTVYKSGAELWSDCLGTSHVKHIIQHSASSSSHRRTLSLTYFLHHPLSCSVCPCVCVLVCRLYDCVFRSLVLLSRCRSECVSQYVTHLS